MDTLRDLLQKIQNGEISLDEAETIVRMNYLEQVDQMAQLDLFRHMRTGIPEVVFAGSKSVDQILQITPKLLNKNNHIILTRITTDQALHLQNLYQNNDQYDFNYNPQGHIITISDSDYTPPVQKGTVGLITAGTSDIPVAEEAKVVLSAMGVTVFPVYDVGVAGMHRIFPPLQKMLQKDVDVFIVAAGMEGTLPGVVSALVDKPVIGVPTSTGYGLGEKGKGALTTMLQSCSPGLAVVNIDNGFGAATFAALILLNKYPKS